MNTFYQIKILKSLSLSTSFSDEEEEHAEAKQEDGQDVQEDAGEAEAAEEEREVREAAQEKEAASPLKCFLYSTRLRFKQWDPWNSFSNKEALFWGSFQDLSQLGQVLPTPVFRVPTDFSYTKVLNNMYK